MDKNSEPFNADVAYKHLLPDGKSLLNNHVEWVHIEKVKIGECKKCKGLHSVGWAARDAKKFVDFCYGCKDFRKFTVIAPSVLR